MKHHHHRHSYDPQCHGHANLGGHAQYQEIGPAPGPFGIGQSGPDIDRIGHGDRGDLPRIEGQTQWIGRPRTVDQRKLDRLRL